MDELRRKQQELLEKWSTSPNHPRFLLPIAIQWRVIQKAMNVEVRIMNWERANLENIN